ncbi:transposase family protein [Methylomonas lenta]|uniref:transposase family protein n=1 Tax=Methylomonas lenta TaxID=980561 RepID=UPI0018DD633B|nr:transposase family protein [Methylomonas lenta]
MQGNHAKGYFSWCKGLYFLPIKDEFTKHIHSPSFCCRYSSSSRSPEKTSTSGYCFVVALCGVICGADNWVEIEEYGRAKPVDALNNVHRTVFAIDVVRKLTTPY